MSGSENQIEVNQNQIEVNQNQIEVNQNQPEVNKNQEPTKSIDWTELGDEDLDWEHQLLESQPVTNVNVQEERNDEELSTRPQQPETDDEKLQRQNKRGNQGIPRDAPIPRNTPIPTKAPYSARVDNLEHSVNDDDLKELFSEYQVVYAGVNYDKEKKRSRGFGIVEFESAEDLSVALSKNGTILKGKTIEVFVKPPQPKKDKPTKKYDKNQNVRYGRGGPVERKENKNRDREGFSHRGGKKQGPSTRGGKTLSNAGSFGHKKDSKLKSEKKEVNFVSSNPFDLLTMGDE